MFVKMRTARYLKAKGSTEAATVQYEARPLLGFSTADRQIVEDVIISRLIE